MKNLLKSTKFKRRLKYIFILLILHFIFLSPYIFGGVLKNADKFTKNNYNDPELKNMASKILGYLRFISIGGILGGIIFYGIQLVSNPDAQTLEKIKEKSMYAIIGSVLVFGALSIVQLLVDFSKGMSF